MHLLSQCADKLLAVMIAALFATTAVAEPFADTSYEDFRPSPLKVLELLSQLESNLSAVDRIDFDWGACRDAAYRARIQCYDSGADSWVCEQAYDYQAAWCDWQFGGVYQP